MMTIYMIAGVVAGVVFCALCAAVVREKHRYKRQLSLVYAALDCIPHGFLFFGRNKKLLFANGRSRSILPQLEGDCSSLQTVDGFLDYVHGEKKSSRKIPVYSGCDRYADDIQYDFSETVVCNSEKYLMQAKHLKDGEFVVFLGMVSELDVADMDEGGKTLQAQKLEALGQLAGGVAHDFNNVLSIVDGYARMAGKCLDDDQSQLAAYLERIRQATKRGSALTKQLLLFGRHKIAGGSVIDLGRTIHEQERLLDPLLESSMNLMIRTDRNLFVQCPADVMSQIIMNLVINARDAMPEGGTITIDAGHLDSDSTVRVIPLHKRGREFIRLSVSDTGTGMDAVTIDRIFDPFFTTKEQGKGTGLGLSTVYGLVTEMKGYIDVSSIPGEGTSFHIYIPASVSEKVKEISEDVEEAGHIMFNGYTVLVAEDEPDLLHILTSMLEELGMEVLSASNGAQALEVQDEYEGDIDLLLTDVVMPELNGVKLAELVQAVREETRTIFMSGFPANGKMARINLPDKAVLLAKPVNYDKLVQVMKQVLEDGDRVHHEQTDLQHWQVA